MEVVNRVNAWLSKLVGPNAAHVIDGLIAMVLVGGVAEVASPSARAFLDQHPSLALAVTLAVPAVTALASKFRKASTLPPSATVVNIAVAKDDTPVA